MDLDRYGDLLFAIEHVFVSGMAERNGGKLRALLRCGYLPNGRIRMAEIHWYEAQGIGKREFKLKLPFLD
jgi:hypothetical protein